MAPGAGRRAGQGRPSAGFPGGSRPRQKPLCRPARGAGAGLLCRALLRHRRQGDRRQAPVRRCLRDRRSRQPGGAGDTGRVRGDAGHSGPPCQHGRFAGSHPRSPPHHGGPCASRTGRALQAQAEQPGARLAWPGGDGQGRDPGSGRGAAGPRCPVPGLEKGVCTKGRRPRHAGGLHCRRLPCHRPLCAEKRPDEQAVDHAPALQGRTRPRGLRAHERCHEEVPGGLCRCADRRLWRLATGLRRQGQPGAFPRFGLALHRQGQAGTGRKPAPAGLPVLGAFRDLVRLSGPFAPFAFFGGPFGACAPQPGRPGRGRAPCALTAPLPRVAPVPGRAA